jgi:molecular chaperone DnaJ
VASKVVKKKDYYKILGVSPKESKGGIRTAYRELAKKHHPDRAGHEATRAFQDLTEAYSVLSDPEARESYNQSLQKEEQSQRLGRKSQRPVAKAKEAFSRGKPTAIRDRDEEGWSQFREIFEGFFGRPTKAPFAEISRHQQYEVEVILSPDEALDGGVVPLTVPILEACPVCAARGGSSLFLCLHCRGFGVIEAERTVRLEIPPSVKDGAVWNIPLARTLEHDFTMRVHVRIENSG